ncbi:acyl-CoA dehydrogenase family protein [Bradyrhizobium sp. Pear76]|nr:acyl-CoA dehydrogenase family protein [Bradyrhizobium oropedii]MCC8961393.1 acyl-CoA dehydrogenase family protein [Bradyrhizobium oropedii]
MTTSEERNAICDAVRGLMQDRSSETAVRSTMETPQGYDPALWAQLVELGIVGLLIDPEYGGTGLGPLELELVMEETGAALLCSPLLSSGVLAASLLSACGEKNAQARYLPGIAAGTTIATVALTGDAGTWTPEGVTVDARSANGGALLNGVASYVTHGQIANLLLIVAKTGSGLGIFEVDANASGLTRSALPSFDRTLRLARLEFANTPARQVGQMGWPAVQEALDVALVALAGEQAGGGRRIFEMTVEYAKTRIQFGRPIGGFQALKHMAADLMIEVESSTSAARHAAEQLAEKTNQAEEAVSLAAFACAEAYSKVAATAIQMHGGIAFTWEHPAHLYLRRARAYAQLFGSPSLYRERYLTQLGA